MMTETRISVCFLPWLSIGKTEHLIGRVRFVPAKVALEKMESRVATQVRLILNWYIESNDAPVANPTICVIDDQYDFPGMGEGQLTDIWRAVDSLWFSSFFLHAKMVIKDGWEIRERPSPGQFTLIRHDAVVGSRNFAVQTPYGAIVNCSYEHMRQARPLGVGICDPSYDQEMLRTLNSLMNSKGEHLKDRVFGALDWVRLAHGDSSLEARTVMECTAFEMLLDVGGDRGKRLALMQKLDSLCKTSLSSTTLVKLRQREYTVSEMASYLNDFYELRNGVVHGEAIKASRLYEIREYQGKERRFEKMLVADVLFAECLWHQLCKLGLTGLDCKRLAGFLKKIECQDTHHELWKQNAPTYLGTRTLHRELGWCRQDVGDGTPDGEP